MKLLKLKLILIFMFSASSAYAQHSHDGEQNHGHRHSGEVAVELNSDSIQHEESLHRVPTVWTNQNGEEVQIQDFAGQPLIVVMFYGKCTETCPMLIQRTWKLYSSLDQELQEKVQVLAVSFDYKNDSPEVLKEYAEYEQLDLPGWNFVTADQADIRMLASLLGVQYRERNDGHFDHSNLITVLDRQGVITRRIEGITGDMSNDVKFIEQMSQ